MKKILSMMGIALLMASCTEDYKDWADPITNGPEEAIEVGISASPASAVDFATVTTETVQLFNATLTGVEGATATYSAEITNEDGSKSIALQLNEDLTVSTSELEKAVYALYGRRPVARTIPVNVSGLINLNGTSYASKASTTLTATPNAPEIEEAYYITGTVNGWDNTNTDFELSNGGADPYENSVFIVTIPGDKVTGDIEFKVTPKSGLGGDWSKCLTASENEGVFATNNAGGNLKVAYVEGAKFYRITFDMMNQTWNGETLDFAEYIWQAGNGNGWGNPASPLYGPAFDGKYVGFMYLDGEFKFRSGEDNWDAPDWGTGGSEGTLAKQAGNLSATAGYYKVDVDLAAMTYALTPITSIGIVGPGQAGGWDSDTDMTYNKETGAWEVTIDLNADEIKFRANDGWDINWGGTEKALTQGGANIKITEAGNYFVQLFAYCDGKAYCKITKK